MGAGHWIALVVVAGAACGGDRRPDTGYGASQPVPAPMTCEDLCARVADCAVHLCNEDTHSDRYTGLEDLLALDCEASCTEALLAAEFTADEWQCLFESTCREVLDYDDCGHGDYNCD